MELRKQYKPKSSPGPSSKPGKPTKHIFLMSITSVGVILFTIIAIIGSAFGYWSWWLVLLPIGGNIFLSGCWLIYRHYFPKTTDITISYTEAVKLEMREAAVYKRKFKEELKKARIERKLKKAK